MVWRAKLVSRSFVRTGVVHERTLAGGPADGTRVSQQLLDVLKQQRRRRRRGFWLGFLAIFVVGGLWAQLSKDPIGPAFANDFVVEAEEEIFFEDVPAIPEPPITTMPETTTITEPTTTGEGPETTPPSPDDTLVDSETTVTQP